ncbi:MAG: TolC family protein [Chlamydiales bacterium]|nr:TolC family protein [Chlamydiales bacterium]
MSVIKFFIQFLIIVCLFFGTLKAEEFDHPLTLSEIVDIALSHHPLTKQVWWKAQRAASVVGDAKSAYYPYVGVEAFVEHGRDFQFINGPNTNYTITGADLVLSLLLYDSEERTNKVKASKMALIAAQWHVDWAIQKVMVDALVAAYATLHAQEVFQATFASFEDAKKLSMTTEELYRVGLKPISDVYTTKAMFAQMKMELSEKLGLLEIQKGKLAASLGLSANTCLQLAMLNPVQYPQGNHIAALICLANKKRADLLAKRSQLYESYYNLNKVSASFGPKVFLSGRGGLNHAFHDQASGGQYQVALNLEMPLFNGFETIYKNRIAYADTKLTQEELAQVQLDIALEVLTYSKSLESAEKMLPDASSNLENSQNAYEIVVEKYSLGEEKIAEVSNAQMQLAAARIKYSDTKTKWLLSIANLAYATGTLTHYSGAQCN